MCWINIWKQWSNVSAEPNAYGIIISNWSCMQNQIKTGRLLIDDRVRILIMGINIIPSALIWMKIRQTHWQISQFLSPEIDFLGTLRFHVTADKLCDTSPCHGGLQTLWSIRLCFYSDSSLKPVHTFSSISDSTIQAVKKKSKTTSLIELEQQQKKIDSKKRHCPFDSTDVAFCCLHGWSFSLCVLLSPPRSSSLSLASLPAVFNGWVEAGKKEREREWVRQTVKKRRMRRMRMEGGEG